VTDAPVCWLVLCVVCAQILVNERQRGNPILEHVTNMPWTYATPADGLIADYLLGSSCCALYLSLRYHLLNPKYVTARMAAIQYAYRTRIVLVHVDVDDAERALEDVTRIAFVHNWTLVCAWTSQECARYLETFRMFENKSAESIRERVDPSDGKAMFAAVLSTVRSVNKSDVSTLAQQFGVRLIPRARSHALF
jgi:DNA excision repair protein ERCC-1